MQFVPINANQQQCITFTPVVPIVSPAMRIFVTWPIWSIWQLRHPSKQEKHTEQVGLISHTSLESLGLHTHTRAIMLTKHFKYHQDHTIECVTAWPFYLPRNKRQVGAELGPNFVPAKLGQPNVVHPNFLSCSPVTLSCPIIQLYLPNKHACGIFIRNWHVYSMKNKTFLIHYHDWKRWFTK